MLMREGQTLVKVLFETSAWNHLDEGTISALEDAQRRGQVEIATCISSLEEITATSDPNRRKVLANCVLRLSVGRIVKKWNQLIRDELQTTIACAFLPGPFLSMDDQEKWKINLQHLVKGEIEEVALRAFQDEQKLEKKKALERQRKMFTERQELFGSWPTSGSFEDFLSINWRPHWNDQMRNLLERSGIKASDENIMLVESHLEELLHLKAGLRIVPALVFSERNNGNGGRGPKRGDRYDLYHMVSAATLDAFICDEPGLKPIFQSTYPQKDFLSLGELLEVLCRAENLC